MRLLAVVLVVSVLPGCLFSTRPYRGPTSDHFDGERFRNTHSVVAQRKRGFFGALGSFLKWQLEGESEPWPDWIEITPGLKPVERVGLGELRVTFVNHATVLVQMDGLNILTDPVWSYRVGPLPWLGVRRVHDPGIAFEDLPPIDLVLISHNHYDHLDLPTLTRLMTRDAPRIAAGLGTARFLRDSGIRNARDFDWWDSVRLERDVRITAVPLEHFSMRGFADRDTMLWTGFVIEGPSGRFFFAGDTGYGSHFRRIRERLGPIRLALIPIGAYRPRWFMAPVHVDPAQAVKAHLDLQAEYSVAIHFGTFDQADEGPRDPVEELRHALGAAHVDPECFWVLAPGHGRWVPMRGDAGPPGGI